MSVHLRHQNKTYVKNKDKFIELHFLMEEVQMVTVQGSEVTQLS